MAQQRLAKKLLLIGWDAADWQIIQPLLEQGLMPNLQRVINSGVRGDIATIKPILSPMLWNSIATGKRPDKHGILSFMEPDPDHQYVRPSTSTSRKVKAIWNILSQNELSSQVIAWYAGHPAEPIRGCCVSEYFQKTVDDFDKPLPVKPGTFHPPELETELAQCRLYPADIDSGMLVPLVPGAAKINPEKDKSISVVARLLAEVLSVHAAATYLLKNKPWDFAAVYYESIDQFSHSFMPYRPPKLDGISKEDFDFYKNVVNGVYSYHDTMLGRLLDLAGPETVVMIVSDHGFYSDHRRPEYISKEPAGAAVCHRPFGILCMSGPGIRKGERIDGASILDVTPTLLTLFGLPVGQDMDGKVLVQAFEKPPALERINSWEDIPGDAGMHPPEKRQDPLEAQEAINQLVALGYIAPLEEDKQQAVRRTILERQANLAMVYADAGKFAEAISLLETLISELPNRILLRFLLAQCYRQAGRRREAQRMVEGVLVPYPLTPFALLQLVGGTPDC